MDREVSGSNPAGVWEFFTHKEKLLYTKDHELNCLACRSSAMLPIFVGLCLMSAKRKLYFYWCQFSSYTIHQTWIVLWRCLFTTQRGVNCDQILGLEEELWRSTFFHLKKWFWNRMEKFMSRVKINCFFCWTKLSRREKIVVFSFIQVFGRLREKYVWKKFCAQRPKFFW